LASAMDECVGNSKAAPADLELGVLFFGIFWGDPKFNHIP